MKKVSMLVALAMCMGISVSTLAELPNGVAIINGKAYDLEYVNDTKNKQEIQEEILSSEHDILVKDFQGKWITNMSGKNIKDSTIPYVEFKDKNGQVTVYDYEDGSEISFNVKSMSFNKGTLEVAFNREINPESAVDLTINGEKIDGFKIDGSRLIVNTDKIKNAEVNSIQIAGIKDRTNNELTNESMNLIMDSNLLKKSNIKDAVYLYTDKNLSDIKFEGKLYINVNGNIVLRNIEATDLVVVGSKNSIKLENVKGKRVDIQAKDSNLEVSSTSTIEELNLYENATLTNRGNVNGVKIKGAAKNVTLKGEYKNPVSVHNSSEITIDKNCKVNIFNVSSNYEKVKISGNIREIFIEGLSQVNFNGNAFAIYCNSDCVLEIEGGKVDNIVKVSNNAVIKGEIDKTNIVEKKEDIKGSIDKWTGNNQGGGSVDNGNTTPVQESITLESVVNPEAINVPYGINPELIQLPEIIKVTLKSNISGNKTSEVKVKWDRSTFNPLKEGEQTIYGELQLNSNVSNPSKIKAEAKIIVARGQFDIVSIVDIKPIYAEVGTKQSELPLPATVTVKLDTGKFMQIPVTSWKCDNYDSNTAKDYTFTSKLELPVGIQNPNGVQATAIVKLGQEFPGVSVSTVELDNIDEIQVSVTAKEMGEDKLNDNVSLVIFDEESNKVANIDELSPVDGKVTFTTKIPNGNYYGYINSHKGYSKFKFKINALEYNIVGVDELANIGVPYGTSIDSIELPEQVGVSVKSENGNPKKAMLNVSWDTSKFDPNKVGEQILVGKIQDKEHVNIGGNVATLKVVVDENTIYSIHEVEALDSINVPYGANPELITLPSTVKASVADNKGGTSKIDVKVNWDKSKFNPIQEGPQEILGTLVLPDNVMNPNGVNAKITLVVEQGNFTITSIGEVKPIYAEVGTKQKDLGLPQYVVVTLDNGRKTNLQVEWKSDDYDEEVIGEYTFTGTLALMNGLTNPNGLKATLKVKIGEALPGITVTTTDIEGTEEMKVAVTAQEFDEEKLNDQVSIVIYDENDKLVYIDELAGTNGKVEFNTVLSKGSYYGYINAFKGYSKFKFRINNQVQEKVYNVKEIGALNPINVPYGMNPELITLPGEAEVKLVDNTGAIKYENMKIKWDLSTFNPLKEGTQTIYGDVQLVEGYTNTKNLRASINIIVEQGNFTMTSIDALKSVYVELGTQQKDLEFPSYVTATLDNGKKVQISVNGWSCENYNPDVQGEYTFKGMLVLSEGITNPNGIEATIKVKVGEVFEGIAVDAYLVENNEINVSVTAKEFGEEKLNNQVSIVIYGANDKLVYVDELSPKDGIVTFNTLLPNGEYYGYINSHKGYSKFKFRINEKTGEDIVFENDKVKAKVDIVELGSESNKLKVVTEIKEEQAITQDSTIVIKDEKGMIVYVGQGTIGKDIPKQLVFDVDLVKGQYSIQINLGNGLGIINFGYEVR